MRVTLTLLVTLYVAAALADPASKPKPGKNGKAPDIQVPAFEPIPKGDNLKAPSNAPVEGQLKSAGASASYSIVKVEHARQFRRGTSGLAASGPLSEITLSGRPPTTERFATRVRIKSPQKQGAPVEVSIVDSKGTVVMSANTQVTFSGIKGDEADGLVEWEPTAYPQATNLEVRVSVAGQPPDVFPLKVIAK